MVIFGFKFWFQKMYTALTQLPALLHRLTGARFFTVLFILVLSQTVTAAEPGIDLARPYRPDFTGSWEKDYQRSDTWESELNRQIQQLLGSSQGTQQSASGIQIGRQTRSRPSEMVDLARLAEMISRQNVLEITQTADEVFIERQGDAALICGTRLNVMESFASPQGSEICGWESQQLIFRITLPEDVDILHRFSVSVDGNWLNMLTSISRKGSQPFNLIQMFKRFDMPAGGTFNCVQTLGRGRACSALGTGSGVNGEGVNGEGVNGEE